MFRIPYETVAIEADKYIICMAIEYDSYLVSYYWKMYLFFLDACGWDDRSYDNETIARVDENWDIKEKIIWN